MNIAVVSTSDIGGGAARAAYRLHRALLQARHNSEMLVCQKETVDGTVRQIVRPALANLLTRLNFNVRRIRLATYRHPPGYEPFQYDHSAFHPFLIHALGKRDVINLHWVARFVDQSRVYKLAARANRLVWTLHDMLPFTGGCHYDEGCDRFSNECGYCPQLGSQKKRDLSATLLARRDNAFQRIPDGALHFVSPSRWLADALQSSRVARRFDVTVIPNSIELDVFCPSDRATARDELGLARDGPIVLFIAEAINNRRKGMGVLVEALNTLATQGSHVALVSVGHASFPVPARLTYKHFPHTSDDRFLAKIYSACDAVVIPSIQDNLPNTMLEAMACGTSVIGSSVGGIPDFVRDRETGYLFPPGDVVALTNAIRSVVQDRTLAKAFGARASELVRVECSPQQQASRYLALFTH